MSKKMKPISPDAYSSEYIQELIRKDIESKEKAQKELMSSLDTLRTNLSYAKSVLLNEKDIMKTYSRPAINAENPNAKGQWLNAFIAYQSALFEIEELEIEIEKTEAQLKERENK